MKNENNRINVKEESTVRESWKRIRDYSEKIMKENT